MTIDCGSQFFLCDLPIRLDTYSGCSHGCNYCFTQRKISINKIKKIGTLNEVKSFCEGKRGLSTTWADWNIPLHWGGMSDPFQPIEKKQGISLEVLKYLVEKQYPFVVSTKGKLIIEEPYKNLLKKANCVLQISLVSKTFDKIELGAPTFQERCNIIKEMKGCKRIIVRCQPYLPTILDETLENIKLYSEIGVYGIIFEGYKHITKKEGFEKLAGDFVIRKDILKYQFTLLKNQCHKYGLKFYCGENRLREMSDDLCCCGIDGLEGFRGNKYNLNHFLYDKENYIPTEAMKQSKSGVCSLKCIQSKKGWNVIKNISFEKVMNIFVRDKSKLKIMGKEF